MRLREVQAILLRQLPGLRGLSVVPQPNNQYRVEGLNAFRVAISELSKIVALATEVAPLAQHPLVMSTAQDVILTDPSAGSNLQQLGARLDEFAGRLMMSLSAALPKEEPLSVSFRLPDVASLSDLTRDVGEVEDVFTQALAPTGFGGSRVLGFDTGSMWISIGLETKEALGLIAALTTTAIAYLKFRRQTGETQVAAKKTSTDPTELVVIERMFERMIAERRTEAITAIAPKRLGPEDRARLGVAVDKMADLLNRGAEVIPALNAPTDVQASYEAAKALVGSVEVAPAQLGQGEVAPPPGTER